jgi:hypothetical protein
VALYNPAWRTLYLRFSEVIERWHHTDAVFTSGQRFPTGYFRTAPFKYLFKLFRIIFSLALSYYHMIILFDLVVPRQGHPRLENLLDGGYSRPSVGGLVDLGRILRRQEVPYPAPHSRLVFEKL